MSENRPEGWENSSFDGNKNNAVAHVNAAVGYSRKASRYLEQRYRDQAEDLPEKERNVLAGIGEIARLGDIFLREFEKIYPSVEVDRIYTSSESPELREIDELGLDGYMENINLNIESAMDEMSLMSHDFENPEYRAVDILDRMEDQAEFLEEELEDTIWTES